MKLFLSKIINYFYITGQAWQVVWLDIWHEWIGRVMVIINGILWLGSWVMASVLYFLGGSKLLILHYSVHFGIDFIGRPAMIYWLPLGLTVAIALNSFLPLVHYSAPRQLRLVILIGTLLVSTLVNVALGSLLFINFY